MEKCVWKLYKCPYSISDKSPTNNDVNLNFLIKGSDGNKELKKSQCQLFTMSASNGCHWSQKVHILCLYCTWPYNE